MQIFARSGDNVLSRLTSISNYTKNNVFQTPVANKTDKKYPVLYHSFLNFFKPKSLEWDFSDRDLTLQ